MPYQSEKNYPENHAAFNTGVIILINMQSRSAFIMDEQLGKLVEAPISFMGNMADYEVGGSGIESIPKEGARVLLSYQNGRATIIGYDHPYSTMNTIEEKAIRRKATHSNQGDILDGLVEDNLFQIDGYHKGTTPLFGSEDPVYRKIYPNFTKYNNNAYEDLVPGDKVISTKDGNMVGVLEGGVNYFKASELCQLIGIKYNDLMRLISRNFQHFSDFGNIIIENDEGRTSYILEGATSYKNASLGKFNLKIQMGFKGDIYKISVTDGYSKELSFLHMKANGEVEIFSEKGVTITSRGFRKDKTFGDIKNDLQGAYDINYSNNYKKTIGGNEERSLVGNKPENIGKNATNVIGGDSTENIGGVRKTSIRGDLLFGNGSFESIFVGSKVEEITTLGDFEKHILIKGDYSRDTKLGDFNDSTLAGDFIRSTLKGDYTDDTLVGDFSRSTTAGDIDDSTSFGTITRSATGGNIEDTVTLGDYKVSVTGGKISLENDTVTIEASTSGAIKLSNAVATIEVTATGAVNIDTPMDIKLGTTAVQKAVLGDLFMTMYNSHFHATAVGPSGVPIVPMTPVQLSSTVSVAF